MMKPTVLLQALGVGIIAMFTASAASAATITLTGTIRDFNDTHPDFEKVIKTDKGIVQSTLGSDGKPVYAGSPTTPTTNGKASFDQWYRDIPRVNVSKPHTITLSNTSKTPGIFSYTNNKFFPIDNQLFGNQGRSHNYHFTYEIASQFTYKGGETLTFSGDDDVWVFLNKKLVVDLGGVHEKQTKSLNLDELVDALKITPGKTYDFHLFFAERHTNESNFSLTTSLTLKPKPVPEPLTIGATAAAAALGCWMKRKQKAAHAS